MSDERPSPLERLTEHEPAGPGEAEDLERIVDFVERKDEPFDRTDPEGHVVASAIVASPTMDRVVLLHHDQLDMWLQPGGHAEPGETDGKVVARREAAEETGLEVRPHPAWPDLLDVDVHEIPESGDMPAHEHLDLRFMFVADPEAEPVAPEDEANAVGWFDIETARRKLELDEGLQRALWKVKSLRVDAGHEGQTRRP